MSQPDESTPIEPELEDLELPIDYIFQLDPDNLTEDDLTSLVRFYRAERLNFLKVSENRPKQVKAARGPAMTPQKTSKAFDDLLNGMIRSLPKASDPTDLSADNEEEDDDE